MDFQCLYEKYAPAVRRFALFLCGDRALADDITSDTFLRVWLTRGRIRELTVKSYLFAVARNAYRDLQRRAWRSGSSCNRYFDVRPLSWHQIDIRFILSGTFGAQFLPWESGRGDVLGRMVSL